MMHGTINTKKNT